MSNENESDQKKGIPRSGMVTIAVSSLIIAGTMALAIFDRLPVLGERGEDEWLPLTFAMIGVLLYVMTIIRKRRDRFKHSYTPDFFYRGAQAVVYLYLIMAIFAQTKGEAADQYEFTNWPPSLIGLFVGLFIQHVEKAVEGLGQRFEEALAAILPRALTSKTTREKQLDQLRTETRFDEIFAQAEGLASQIRDPALETKLREKLNGTLDAIRSGDHSGMKDKLADLAWFFEEAKVSLREDEMTIAEILGQVSEEKKDKGQ